MLFAVASGLVNCTNSYDYEEPDPKMVELAKYAKQHVPEQHPKVRGPLKGFGDVSASVGPGDSGHTLQLSLPFRRVPFPVFISSICAVGRVSSPCLAS